LVRLLSHKLSPDTPTYPGTPGTSFVPNMRIDNGDVANVLVFTTQNHAGTHVDGPWHFNPEGRRIDEIDPAEFVFTSPIVVDIPKNDDEIIGHSDLAGRAPELAGHDLILVRTGYGARWRSAEPERYRHHSPGFDAAAGRFLVDRLPDVRAIALDFISASAQVAEEEGLEFHRTLLGRGAGDRYVFIVEDARIDADIGEADLGLVVMAPLLLEGQDGGQVTMLAIPGGFSASGVAAREPRPSN
jgi:arylformamidase